MTERAAMDEARLRAMTNEELVDFYQEAEAAVDAARREALSRAGLLGICLPTKVAHLEAPRKGGK